MIAATIMRNIFVGLLFIFYVCDGAPISVSLEEAGGFFEGDMNLNNQQLRDIFVNANAGLLDTRRRWNREPTTRQVQVPYTFRARSFCK